MVEDATHVAAEIMRRPAVVLSSRMRDRAIRIIGGCIVETGTPVCLHFCQRWPCFATGVGVGSRVVHRLSPSRTERLLPRLPPRRLRERWDAANPMWACPRPDSFSAPNVTPNI